MSLEKGVPDVRSELFGGRGTVRVWNLLGQRAEPFTAVLSCELAPGGVVGPHRQEEFAEMVIGIDGQGEAAVDGHTQSLAAGDAIHLPLGAVLSIRNASSDRPLSYLIVKARV